MQWSSRRQCTEIAIGKNLGGKREVLSSEGRMNKMKVAVG